MPIFLPQQEARRKIESFPLLPGPPGGWGDATGLGIGGSGQTFLRWIERVESVILDGFLGK
jgi:hypothetical protein